MMTRASWSTDELHELLSAASHDLRTPLSVITGRASVLRASAREEHRRDLDAIVHEAQRVSRTLESLLAVIEAEAELPAARAGAREWIPFEEVIGAVLARLESSLADRVIAVDVPDDVLVHAHPMRAELLLANLLDHAADLSPPRTAIELAAHRRGAGVDLVVHHSGSAQPPPQVQPGAARRGRRRGALALAACDAIAAAYGGTLRMAARPGGGGAIHVYLPDGEMLPDLTEPAAGGA